MPTDINCVLQFSCTVDGHTVEQGSHVPFVHTITAGEYLDNTVQVAAGATATLWDSAVDQPGEFAFAWILSDQNLYLGIVSFSLTELCFQPFIYANRPYILWGDDVAVETGGVFWAVQSLDQVGVITVKNPTASIARVRVVIGK